MKIKKYLIMLIVFLFLASAVNISTSLEDSYYRIVPRSIYSLENYNIDGIIEFLPCSFDQPENLEIKRMKHFAKEDNNLSMNIGMEIKTFPLTETFIETSFRLEELYSSLEYSFVVDIYINTTAIKLQIYNLGKNNTQYIISTTKDSYLFYLSFYNVDNHVYFNIKIDNDNYLIDYFKTTNIKKKFILDTNDIFIKEVLTSSFNDVESYLKKIVYRVSESENFTFPSLYSIPYFNETTYETEDYWEYNSFSLYSQDSSLIEMDNFNVSYPLLERNETTSRYYYNKKTFIPNEWGNWGLFNWLRDGLCLIVNSVLFFLQFVGFLFTISFSYFYGYVILYMIIGIWNYVIYYIFYALCYIADIFVNIFMYIYNAVLDFFDSFIQFLPLSWESIKNVFELIAGLLILSFSYVVSALLYVIFLGRIDYMDLFSMVYEFSFNISSLMIEILESLIEFLPYFIAYITFFFNMMLMLYLKILYCKARGYTNRVISLQESLDGYMNIVKIAKSIILFVRDLIPLV